MSTVVDAVESDDEAETARRDPFGDEAIEIDEATLRRMSPAAWVDGITRRLDSAVQRFIYR